MLQQPFGDMSAFRHPGTPLATAGGPFAGTPPARRHGGSQGGSASGGRPSGVGGFEGRLSGRSSVVSSRGGQELEQLPEVVRWQDPLFGATVRKIFGQQACYGQVISVDVDTQTGQRAYEVSYEDGDGEHMWELEVRSCLVQWGPSAATQAAAAAAVGGAVPLGHGLGPHRLSSGHLSGGPTPRTSGALGMPPDFAQGFGGDETWAGHFDGARGYRRGNSRFLGPWQIFAATMVAALAMAKSLPWCWSCTFSNLSREPSVKLSSALAEPRPLFGQGLEGASPFTTVLEVPKDPAAETGPRFTVPEPPWALEAVAADNKAVSDTVSVSAGSARVFEVVEAKASEGSAFPEPKQHRSPFPSWAHEGRVATADEQMHAPFAGVPKESDPPASAARVIGEEETSVPWRPKDVEEHSIDETAEHPKPEPAHGETKRKPGKKRPAEAIKHYAARIASMARTAAEEVARAISAAAAAVLRGARKVVQIVGAVLTQAWSTITSGASSLGVDLDTPEDLAAAMGFLGCALFLVYFLMGFSSCRHRAPLPLEESIAAAPNSPLIHASPARSPLAVAAAPPPSPLAVAGAAAPASPVAGVPLPSPSAMAATPQPTPAVAPPTPLGTGAPSPMPARSPLLGAAAPSPLRASSSQMPSPQQPQPLSQRLSQRLGTCQLPSPLQAPGSPSAALSPAAASLLGVHLPEVQGPAHSLGPERAPHMGECYTMHLNGEDRVIRVMAAGQTADTVRVAQYTTSYAKDGTLLLNLKTRDNTVDVAVRDLKQGPFQVSRGRVPLHIEQTLTLRQAAFQKENVVEQAVPALSSQTPVGMKTHNRLVMNETRFRHTRSLSKLKEMGFNDTPEVREVLTRQGGNVNSSLRELLPHMWQR